MDSVPVQIVRFVDESQPGWVECELIDAEGRRHILKDKVPLFTSEQLDADSTYPAPGTVDCEIVQQFRDAVGRELASISTRKPSDIESSEGLSEFIVLASMVIHSGS